MQQGSKTPGQRKDGSLFVRENAGGRLKAWREDIKAEARFAMQTSFPDDGYPLDGPLEVWMTFWFPSIQAGRTYKTTAPDLDKLVRAVGDALEQSRMIKNDARIVRLEASKLHVTPLAPDIGVKITVTKLVTREEDNG